MYGNPTNMRGSGTESKNEVCMAFWAKDEVRHPGASEGRKAIVGLWEEWIYVQ